MFDGSKMADCLFDDSCAHVRISGNRFIGGSQTFDLNQEIRSHHWKGKNKSIRTQNQPRQNCLQKQEFEGSCQQNLVSRSGRQVQGKETTGIAQIIETNRIAHSGAFENQSRDKKMAHENCDESHDVDRADEYISIEPDNQCTH